MRKEIIIEVAAPAGAAGESWMDLGSHAHVRLTSEDAARPIEDALQERTEHGWRAAAPGAQTIWIDFDVPQAIRQIQLRFEAGEARPRTQEFVLTASSDEGRSYREVVRQQFNFSAAATTENEDYFPGLSGVTDLKLTIVPDISGGEARATLRALRIR